MLAPQRGRSTLSSGRSPGSWRLSIIACCLELLIRSVDSTVALSSSTRVSSAQQLGCSLGSRPTLWAAAMRLRSAPCSGRIRSPYYPWFSCSGSGSAQYPIRLGRQGPVCPHARTGAQLGLFFGQLCQLVFPDLNIQPEGFAAVGMAAFFTGVVRAPLTGIVLVVETTANVTMLLPMLGACFMAMLAPTLMRDPPIYDSLRERTLERETTHLNQEERVAAGFTRERE
jgi:Voltage gated chloride channel